MKQTVPVSEQKSSSYEAVRCRASCSCVGLALACEASGRSVAARTISVGVMASAEALVESCARARRGAVSKGRARERAAPSLTFAVFAWGTRCFAGRKEPFEAGHGPLSTATAAEARSGPSARPPFIGPALATHSSSARVSSATTRACCSSSRRSPFSRSRLQLCDDVANVADTTCMNTPTTARIFICSPGGADPKHA